MKFDPKPLTVVCDTCGASAQTWDSSTLTWQSPAAAALSGMTTRGSAAGPSPSYASAHLTLFDIRELMEMAAERDAVTPAETPVITS